MNEKEKMIVSSIRKDARASLVGLSEAIGMPISTIYDKLNRLQRDEVIRRFTALVDFSKLGYNHRMHIVLKINKSEKLELIEFLKSSKCLNSLHEIDNGYDFMFETIHKDIKEYVEFKDILMESFEILEMREYQIVGEVERECFSN